jgi:hypothetical protein
LNIQIANRRGLRERLLEIDAHEMDHTTPEQRIEWSCRTFGEPRGSEKMGSE